MNKDVRYSLPGMGQRKYDINHDINYNISAIKCYPSAVYEHHFSIEDVYFFLIYGPNIKCGCLLEPHQCGGSNKHTNICFVQK